VRSAVVSNAEHEREAEQEHDRTGSAKDAGDTGPLRAVRTREEPPHVALVDPSRLEGRAQLVQERVISHTGYI
jgi:hypothetical protein